MSKRHQRMTKLGPNQSTWQILIQGRVSGRAQAKIGIRAGEHDNKVRMRPEQQRQSLQKLPLWGLHQLETR